MWCVGWVLVFLYMYVYVIRAFLTRLQSRPLRGSWLCTQSLCIEYPQCKCCGRLEGVAVWFVVEEAVGEPPQPSVPQSCQQVVYQPLADNPQQQPSQTKPSLCGKEPLSSDLHPALQTQARHIANTQARETSICVTLSTPDPQPSTPRKEACQAPSLLAG